MAPWIFSRADLRGFLVYSMTLSVSSSIGSPGPKSIDSLVYVASSDVRRSLVTVIDESATVLSSVLALSRSRSSSSSSYEPSPSSALSLSTAFRRTSLIAIASALRSASSSCIVLISYSHCRRVSCRRSPSSFRSVSSSPTCSLQIPSSLDVCASRRPSCASFSCSGVQRAPACRFSRSPRRMRNCSVGSWPENSVEAALRLSISSWSAAIVSPAEAASKSFPYASSHTRAHSERTSMSVSSSLTRRASSSDASRCRRSAIFWSASSSASSRRCSACATVFASFTCVELPPPRPGEPWSVGSDLDVVSPAWLAIRARWPIRLVRRKSLGGFFIQYSVVCSGRGLKSMSELDRFCHCGACFDVGRDPVLDVERDCPRVGGGDASGDPPDDAIRLPLGSAAVMEHSSR
mmetsp:Transcript_61820/g.163896  ORF Transcript_61820/g.163896 Transcript_61820/m.163896 type:complete len:406 (+) Transcript_61820:907-2124(+)